MAEEKETRVFIHGDVPFEVDLGAAGDLKQQWILQQIARRKGRHYDVWRERREEEGLVPDLEDLNPSGLATAFVAGLTNEPVQRV